jgi:deoxyadenosine/deoxycytidine kinase
MLICIEGCLGVGKSTLVQRVAARLPCTPFYEEIEANPFLLDFYRDPKQYALHVQYTFFLLQARQFRAAVEHARTGRKAAIEQETGQTALAPGAAGTTAICDFHPFKSLVFASVVLQPEERAPLTQLYHLLHMPQPDLVVYLRADEHTILARLRKRHDVYQADLDFTYVTRVCRAYETFFRTYSGPCVTIDTTHIDYVSNPQELSVLLQQIPLLFAS